MTRLLPYSPQPGWRSEEERRAIFDQFQEAAAVYERLRVEAGGAGP